MLICLVGKSGSGKDTVARILEEKYGKKPVCSYTSRPVRDNETDGVEHHFITREEAENILKNRADEVVAQTEINGNLYFALKEDLERADLYIIDPNGLDYLEEHFPEIELWKVYVYVDEAVAKERVSQRGDNLQVYESRKNSEDKMFDDYYADGKPDYIVNNNGTIEDIHTSLKNMFNSYEFLAE